MVSFDCGETIPPSAPVLTDGLTLGEGVTLGLGVGASVWTVICVPSTCTPDGLMPVTIASGASEPETLTEKPLRLKESETALSVRPR